MAFEHVRRGGRCIVFFEDDDLDADHERKLCVEDDENDDDNIKDCNDGTAGFM
jgi:hypothetical protein